MTKHQQGYTIWIMLLTFIPVFEISRQIYYYTHEYGASYWLGGELVVYWACWFAIILVARRMVRRRA